MSRRARQLRRRRSQTGPARAVFVLLGVAVATAIIAVARRRRLHRQRRRVGARHRGAEAGRPGRHVGRLRRRRQDAPGLHPGRHAAHARPRRRDAPVRPRRDRRDRGPPLLQARRRRLRGHRPRGDQERVERRDRPGRLDADDAARPQPLQREPRAQRHRRVQAQDPRGEARLRARGPPPRAPRQALDPHAVPEQRAVRHRRRPDGRRHPVGLARLLRQAREPPHAAGGRAARRPAAGALGLQPVPRTRRRARARRDEVLDQMRRSGYITASRPPRRAAPPLGVRALGLLRQAPRELLLRLRPHRADQEVRRRRACARAGSRSTRRST